MKIQDYSNGKIMLMPQLGHQYTPLLKIISFFYLFLITCMSSRNKILLEWVVIGQPIETMFDIID